jgi:hypothetical protein
VSKPQRSSDNGTCRGDSGSGSAVFTYGHLFIWRGVDEACGASVGYSSRAPGTDQRLSAPSNSLAATRGFGAGDRRFARSGAQRRLSPGRRWRRDVGRRRLAGPSRRGARGNRCLRPPPDGGLPGPSLSAWSSPTRRATTWAPRRSGRSRPTVDPTDLGGRPPSRYVARCPKGSPRDLPC